VQRVLSSRRSILVEDGNCGKGSRLKRVFLFNWHMYALAAVALLVAAALHWPVVCAVIVWYVLASLIAAHWIYERSGLHQLRWLTENIQTPPSKIVVACAGYDELQGRVSAAFPDAQIEFVDFYKSLEKRERSIERAQKLGAVATEVISDQITGWPTSEAELVIFAFAAHELRIQQSQTTLLQEAARVIAQSGTVAVVEQLRDLPNFLAFGPGFLHFYSRSRWLHTFNSAGLMVRSELKLSPFATVFLLCKTTH
jgi:hypothetical protein